MNRLAKGIIKFKWVIIIAVIVLTGFLAYQIKDLKIDSDIISSLPDDDPAALLYKDIGKEFGGNDMGMIIIETDNVFKKEVIEYIKQIMSADIDIGITLCKKCDKEVHSEKGCRYIDLTKNSLCLG